MIYKVSVWLSLKMLREERNCLMRLNLTLDVQECEEIIGFSTSGNSQRPSVVAIEKPVTMLKGGLGSVMC